MVLRHVGAHPLELTQSHGRLQCWLSGQLRFGQRDCSTAKSSDSSAKARTCPDKTKEDTNIGHDMQLYVRPWWVRVAVTLVTALTAGYHGRCGSGHTGTSIKSEYCILVRGYSIKYAY